MLLHAVCLSSARPPRATGRDSRPYSRPARAVGRASSGRAPLPAEVRGLPSPDPPQRRDAVREPTGRRPRVAPPEEKDALLAGTVTAASGEPLARRSPPLRAGRNPAAAARGPRRSLGKRRYRLRLLRHGARPLRRQRVADVDAVASESCRDRRDGRRDGGQGRHRTDSGDRPRARPEHLDGQAGARRGCARHHLPDGRDPGAGADGHPRHALPAEAGAPDPEPAGCAAPIPGSRRATGACRFRTTSSRADVWRLDPPNGNLLPWLLIESPLGVANVREIRNPFNFSSL